MRPYPKQMPKYPRQRWLPEEEKVVERYARALATGEYPDTWRAAEACRQDIERLYVQLLAANPNDPVASHPRPFDTIRRRIHKRLAALEFAGTGARLSAAENRIVNRHARELAQGSYPHAQAAAVACRKELLSLPQRSTPLRPRSLVSIRSHICVRVLRSANSSPFHRWSPDCDAVLERYAKAVVAGRYQSAVAALPDCCRELAAAGLLAGRRTSAVCQRLQERVRALGFQRSPRWRGPEERIFRRYLRLLFEGRFKYVKDAAEACTNEMLRLDGKVPSHSPRAIFTRMNREAPSLGLPRFRGETTPEEQKLFDKYARAVAAARYGSCLEAVPDCHRELRRMYSRVRRANPLRVERLAGRSRGIVHRRIMAAAVRLGLQFPRRRWFPAEQRIFEGWLRWYVKYRHVLRLKPLTQASEGLSDDLAKEGFRRSVCTCMNRLTEGRRRLTSH